MLDRITDFAKQATLEQVRKKVEFDAIVDKKLTTIVRGCLLKPLIPLQLGQPIPNRATYKPGFLCKTALRRYFRR